MLRGATTRGCRPILCMVPIRERQSNTFLFAGTRLSAYGYAARGMKQEHLSLCSSQQGMLSPLTPSNTILEKQRPLLSKSKVGKTEAKKQKVVGKSG